MKEKKTLALILVLGIFIVVIVGWGVNQESSQGANPVTIKVGASPVPHAEILNIVKPILEKEGIKLDVVEFTDYNQPNLQLADKQLDANYFQHILILKNSQKIITLN